MFPRPLLRPAHVPTPNELFSTYRTLYDELEASNQLIPFILPYHLFPCLLLSIYLCIPHKNRPYLYAARWGLLLFTILFNTHTILRVTSINPGFGFISGLICVWQVFWSFKWLILNRPQWDAKRVERRKRRDGEDGSRYGKTKGTTESAGNGADSLRKRGPHIKDTAEKKSNEPLVEGAETREMDNFEYYWQEHPEKLSERIGWTFDLLMNFRGPGWNWRIQTMPDLPPFVKRDLGEPISEASIKGVSSAGIRRFDTGAELLRSAIPKFVVGYLMLDLLKITTMKDPYFLFGPNDYPLPSHLSALSPWFLRLFRLSLLLACITIALELAFLTVPIFYCFILGSRVLGLRAEPWYYSNTWGSWRLVFDKGLAGLWGGRWHQIFRLYFSVPSDYLIKCGLLSPGQSDSTKLVAAFTAFFVSGLFHAGGSFTNFPETRSLGMVVFFMLQAVGIAVQTMICRQFKPFICRLPTRARQAGNFAFAFLWLYGSGHWICDEFARSGLFLYQPIPFSPLRGLGFGHPDERAWCWDNTLWFRRYRGKHWWESGIAF
ncbi:hypothetical protein F5884DRAFT_179918 [Xylogone sp. PMI_703]|nr:hypothetical protein F5884DRAFT_179918 [Xylogone sp. PMI_703]